MADVSVDQLSIEIKASADKASKSIDTLCGKLNTLSASLSRLDGSSLNRFTSAMNNLGNSLARMNGSNIASTAQNLRNLASSLRSLDSIKSSNAINNLPRLSNSIQQLSQSTRNLGGANLTWLGDLGNAVNGLGRSGVQRAITNIPALTTELEKMITTLSRLPQVNQSVIDLTNAISGLRGVNLRGANIANTINNVVGTSGNNGNNGIGGNNVINAISSIGSALKSLGGSAKRTTHNFKGLASAIGKFYATWFLAIRGIKKIWESTESAMDYVETYNYFNVSLNKIKNQFADNFEQFGYDNAEDYMESFSKRLNTLTQKMTGFKIGGKGELFETENIGLGLDPNQLMNFEARIMAVTNSVGLLGETSVNATKALSMLSADLSSLTNTKLDTVMTNLASGLIGQSRALYKYGIDITNATLAQYALENGITKKLSAMTQEEKMQLRLLAILDQSKVAWADQANTINSVANQYRILQQQVANLGRVIGNLLLPIVQKVLPVINGLVIAIRRLLTDLGFKLWGDNWLAQLQDGISGGIGDDFDDLTDSIEDTEKAAKKLKGQLSGLDELNNLSSGSGSDGSVVGGGIDLSGAIADALADYESVWDEALKRAKNKAEYYADLIYNALKNRKFYSIGKFFGDQLTKALDSINWDSVYRAAENFGQGLADFLNGLISPELFGALGKTIAGSINTALHAANAFAIRADWKDFGNSIASGINNFFATMDFVLAADVINNFADGIFTMIYTALDKVNWDAIGKGIGTFLARIKWTKILKNAIKIIAKALSGIANAWTESFKAAPIETVLASLGLLVPILVNKIPGALATIATLGNAATNVLGAEKMLSVTGKIAKSLPTLLKGVGGVVAGLQELFVLKDKVEGLVKGTISLSDGLSSIAVSAGIATAALGIMFGPAGLIASGVIALVGGIWGAKEAYDELLADMSSKSIISVLSNSDGVSIEEVSGLFASSFSEISQGFDDMSESMMKVDDNKSAIDNTVTSIKELRSAVSDGKITVEDAIPQIQKQFEELANEMKLDFADTYDLIYSSLAGGVRDALEANGLSVPALIDLMGGLQNEYNAAIENIVNKQAILDKKLEEGTITSEEYWSLLGPIIDKYYELTGQTDDVTGAMANLNDAISKIDFSSVLNEDGSVNMSALQEAINKVTIAYQENEAQVDEWYESQKKLFDDMIQKAESLGNTDAANGLRTMFESFTKTADDAKVQMETALTDYSDSIQAYILTKLPEVAQNAAEDYKKQGFVYQLFHTEQDSIDTYISDYENNVINPVTETLKDSFADIGKTVNPIAQETMKNLNEDLIVAAKDFSGMNSTYEAAVERFIVSELSNTKDTLNASGSEMAANLVYGFDEGLDFKGPIGAVKGAGKDILSTFQTSLDEHSPSKATYKDGVWFVEGFNNGIDSVAKTAGTAIDNMTKNHILPKLAKDVWRNNSDGVKQGIEEMWKSFTSNFSGSLFPSWYNGLKQLFSKSNFTFNGVVEGLTETFRLALESIKKLWNDFAKEANSKMEIKTSGGNSNQNTSLKLELPSFKTGGFPEDGLFYANHSELVGQFADGRTAVANNEQIIAGIQNGVAMAVSGVVAPYLQQLVASNAEIASKDIEVSSDGIFRNVRNSAYSFSRRTGKDAFSF